MIASTSASCDSDQRRAAAAASRHPSESRLIPSQLAICTARRRVPMWRFVAAVIVVASLSAFGFSATAKPVQSNQFAQAQSSTDSNPQQLDMDAVPSLTTDGIRQVQ